MIRGTRLEQRLFLSQSQARARGSMQWSPWLLACVALLGLTGCAGPPPRNPVPVDQKAQAQVPGMSEARYDRGVFDPGAQARLLQSIRDDPPENYRRNPDGSRSYDSLALSGGGWNGAFGAGFLYGWSKTGTRPNFKIVTGLSTGALIAPFAFLGSDYDEVLIGLYTSVSGAEAIYQEKGMLAASRSDSLADDKPLARLIDKNVDDDLLKAVAREHRRGRHLIVGTTDLDKEELVVWDMGWIADSGHPDALDLFRKVLLASSSIPVFFPPVLIEVEANGVRCDEMHVDGNTTNSAFFHGGIIDIVAGREMLAKEGIRMGGGQLYIIQNGLIDAKAEEVPRTLKTIIGRSVSTLVRSNRRGDLYRMYLRSKVGNVGFNFVAIPGDYVPLSEEPFNQEEMKQLVELGIRMGSSGNAWRPVPPGAGLRRQGMGGAI